MKRDRTEQKDTTGVLTGTTVASHSSLGFTLLYFLHGPGYATHPFWALVISLAQCEKWVRLPLISFSTLSLFVNKMIKVLSGQTLLFPMWLKWLCIGRFCPHPSYKYQGKSGLPLPILGIALSCASEPRGSRSSTCSEGRKHRQPFWWFCTCRGRVSTRMRAISLQADLPWCSFLKDLDLPS